MKKCNEIKRRGEAGMEVSRRETRQARTKKRHITTFPDKCHHGARTEVKLQAPWKIEMSLLKMTSPVIIGAASSSRVVNLLPSVPNPGAPGYLSKRLASRGGQYSTLKSPQSK